MPTTINRMFIISDAPSSDELSAADEPTVTEVEAGFVVVVVEEVLATVFVVEPVFVPYTVPSDEVLLERFISIPDA